mmetsp:Transcript_36031/g.58224  ORF Transcript_36031/g.58224 Transcript_36031/m.58224 type:complete len:182 (+) Transcript_36031:172-717(+)|eukprot:CAMPEP_0184645994 /NCGR_PEP_ID=MMETSP0308-20130426/2628_1 /TAXON_ID=38269 /ORGANISM="Gloeochaete witrockiana, Strain SAG 46.84" /LENGTH=181 /DNA_ID=CAMNT_0027075609 /DNA_START=169 /DNA_END=714 /DNA_ORIENTATION=-
MSSLISRDSSSPFFAEFDRLKREMDRMFELTLRPDNAFLLRDPFAETRTLWRNVGSLFDGVPGANSSSWVPRTNLKETENAYQLQAELPGINADQVKLEIRDGVLRLSGETKKETKNDNDKIHSEERVYGSFARCFRLPGLEQIKPEEVNAEYNNGILNVTLPKKAQLSSAIPIKVLPSGA